VLRLMTKPVAVQHVKGYIGPTDILKSNQINN